jgi:hemerythrin-like domain-containing protein
MDPVRQTSRALHDEHVATLDLLRRVEQALVTLARGGEPDASLVRAVAELDHHLRIEVDRHFRFEEDQIFPRLVEAGEGGITELLRDEHETMRAVLADLLPLTAQAASGALGASQWKSLRLHTGELAERLVAHIEKEEMGLLPLVDDTIDEGTDRELAFAYASS